MPEPCLVIKSQKLDSSLNFKVTINWQLKFINKLSAQNWNLLLIHHFHITFTISPTDHCLFTKWHCHLLSQTPSQNEAQWRAFDLISLNLFMYVKVVKFQLNTNWDLSFPTLKLSTVTSLSSSATVYLITMFQNHVTLPQLVVTKHRYLKHSRVSTTYVSNPSATVVYQQLLFQILVLIFQFTVLNIKSNLFQI